jgi:hypothetical protein
MTSGTGRGEWASDHGAGRLPQLVKVAVGSVHGAGQGDSELGRVIGVGIEKVVGKAGGE